MASFPKPHLTIKLPHYNDARGWMLLCFGGGDTRKKKPTKKVRHDPIARSPQKQNERKQQNNSPQDTENTTTTGEYSDNSGQSTLPPTWDGSHESITTTSTTPYSVSPDSSLAPIHVTSIGQYSLPPLLSIIVQLDQVLPILAFFVLSNLLPGYRYGTNTTPHPVA